MDLASPWFLWSHISNLISCTHFGKWFLDFSYFLQYLFAENKSRITLSRTRFAEMCTWDQILDILKCFKPCTNLVRFLLFGFEIKYTQVFINIQIKLSTAFKIQESKKVRSISTRLCIKCSGSRTWYSRMKRRAVFIPSQPTTDY